MILILKRYNFFSIVTFIQLMQMTQFFFKRWKFHGSSLWKIQVIFWFFGIKMKYYQMWNWACGMKYIDLRNETIKILGVYFSYNQEIKDDKNFYNIIANIQGALNLWRIRNLTLEGRIVLFKTLAISKIVFLALLTKIPYQVKIQKYFLWKDSFRK